VWLVGVDGGGSRTRCWVADESGRVRGRAEAGPANAASVGAAQAAANLRAAVGAALERAGADAAAVAAACFGLAGCDRPRDREALQPMVAALGLGGVCRIENDAVVAWAGATRGRPGVVVIAGTGSIAYGRTGDGRAARAGGWGPLFGDEGSGFSLGRDAVVAALRAADGRGPATALGDLLARELGLAELADVVSVLRWHDAQPARLADLAPLVLRAAEAGDAVAGAIVTRAAADLAAMVGAVLARLGLEPRTALVAGGGSLLTQPTALRRALESALAARGVPALRLPDLPAAAGALLLAWASLGGDPATWPVTG
jgi:N-acetylglucosamine kinase-like BadF-type ATPase